MTSRIYGVRLAGVASAIPTNTVTLTETADCAGITEREAEKIAKMTGVRNRSVAPPGMCASDLGFAAAVKLLEELKWDPRTIDVLVVVSQTHDYDTPATACCLQDRLGLPKTCAAFDMSLGCSGYIYGLWVCSSLLAAGTPKRALFLAGDTSTRFTSPHDRGTAFLFGDAATATALERDENAPPMSFVAGTDGAGRDYLIVPGSGYRNRITAAAMERRPASDGVLRSPLDVHMDGAEVFAFTLRQVPQLMNDVLSLSGWQIGDLDALVPHQANLFMLKHLAKRLNIAPGKLVVSLDEFGNTSSASIPLAMSHRLAPRLRGEAANLILAGFGVGWSWGALALRCGPMVMPDIVYVDREAAREAAVVEEDAVVVARSES